MGSWSFLTQFDINPATPTKTSNRKGSAKTLFYCLLFPILLPINLPNKTPAPTPQDCETACEFSVTLGALLLLLVGLLGRGCSAAGVELKALGGVWSACACGVVGSCGRVLKSAVVWGRCGYYLMIAA